MRIWSWVGLVLAVVSVAVPAGADEFWSHWGDGKAELDGYALTQPRYGQPRAGSAVMIFVTEDFVESTRVKAEKEHPKSDVHPVLKLNFVRDFQTGIYDYNVMTSTFVRPEPGWPLDKTSFSSQEWCGHVYMQWVPRAGKLEGVVHSYFDGEEGRPALPLPANGILEDAVPILVRGLRGPWLKPGESRTLPFLPSQLHTRLLHKPAAWGEATVTRSATPVKVKSVLGEIDADTYIIAVRDGASTTWTIEAAAPHRILAWQSTDSKGDGKGDGEAGHLLGSTRLAYWEMNQPGGEAALKQLGLKPGSMLIERGGRRP